MASLRRGQEVTGISDDEVPDLEVVKKPKRSESPVMLEMSTLRGLLQEQSQGLLPSHQKQLDQALARMEKRQEDMFRTMTGRLDETNTKMEQMESVVEALSKRVVALESAIRIGCEDDVGVWWVAKKKPTPGHTPRPAEGDSGNSYRNLLR